MSWKTWVFAAMGFACANGTNALAKDATNPFYIPRPSFYGEDARAPRDQAPQRNIAFQIGVDFKNVFTLVLVVLPVLLGFSRPSERPPARSVTAATR